MSEIIILRDIVLYMSYIVKVAIVIVVSDFIFILVFLIEFIEFVMFIVNLFLFNFKFIFV